MSRLPWLIVLIAAAAGVGGYLLARQQPAPTRIYASLIDYGQPRAIGDFALDRVDHGRFTAADLRDKISLVFFGFTHCPDVCPTTLAAMRDIDAQLVGNPLAKDLQYVFVSVDPERDSPAALREYATFFSPRIVALRGEPTALDAVTRTFGVVYGKSGEQNGQYNVDHSVQITVVDRAGRIIGVIKPPHQPAAIAADLEILLKQ